MSIPIRANPLGYDSWFVKVTRAFNNSIGEPGKVGLDYVPGNAPILEVFVNLDVSLSAVGDLKAIAGNLVPSGVSVEWYWADGLPMTYTRLEYIENVVGDNTNSASILTDIVPTQNTRGKLIAEAVQSPYAITCYAFGTGSTVNDRTPPFSCSWWYRPSQYGGNGAVFYMNGKRVPSAEMRAGIHTLEFGKDGFRVDGVLEGTFGDIGEFKSPRELMFLSETPAYRHARCFRGKAYSFKLWEGNEPILNFIPALNPSGIPGMYDTEATTVENTFKKSATTTPFVAGMTLRQVRDMNLPVPGTVNTLSLSVSCEVYNDSEAWGVIEAAQQKGWTFTFYWTDVIAYLTPRIDAVVGSGNYTMSYDYLNSILDISVNTDVSPAAFRQMQELLTQIVPFGITQNITWSDGMPADYTRAYFLESNGKQRIDTGRLWNAHDEISILYEPIENSAGNINYNIFGAGTYRMAATKNTSEGVYFTLPGKYAFGSVYGRVKTNAYYSFTELRVNEYSRAITIDDFESASNIFVCDNVASGAYPAYMRLYSYEHKKANDDNMSLIPALNSSGIPGMYDIVSGEFKITSGAEQFVIGMTLDQVISLKLPPAPASPDNKLTISVPGEAVYIQDAQKALNAAVANGWELTIQYRDIETPEFQGYVVADYIAKDVYQNTYIDTGLQQRLLGYFDYMNTECGSPINYSRTWGIPNFYSNNRGTLWYQKSDTGMLIYPTATERPCPIQKNHNIIHLMGGDVDPSIPSVTSYGYIGLSIDGTWGLYATADQWPNETSNTYQMFAYHSAERLYSARFTDIEHKDIANFIPAVDPDGNPCMFDFVRKQPFYNANGTNKFAFTIGLTKEQAESLVLGDKGNGLTIQVPEGTDLDVMQANNPNVTIIIQTIPATTN